MLLIIKESTMIWSIVFAVILSFQLVTASNPRAVASVIEVNTTNFNSFMASKSVLLQFYAPWCSKCSAFASTYRRIAKTLSEQGISCGKIDATDKKNLGPISRFNLTYVPTLFLYRNGHQWQYSGEPTYEDVLDFVERGYKDQPPLWWLNAPMSTFGDIKHVVVGFGGILSQYFAQFAINMRKKHDLTESQTVYLITAVAVLVVLSSLATVVIISFAVQSARKYGSKLISSGRNSKDNTSNVGKSKAE